MHRIYTNARVHTMTNRPVADALAVDTAGRIAAVGTVDECVAALRQEPDGGVDVEAIDLEGRVVLPGFIDAHQHPIPTAALELHLDLRGVHGEVDLREHLRAHARRIGGRAVRGLNLEPGPAGVLPTREVLDAEVGDRPCVLLARDYHTAVGNSAALAAAGISHDTPDPEGGAIDRDPAGRPTGVCRETAARLLLSSVQGDAPEDVDEAAAAYVERCVAQGITSVGAILQTDDEGPAGPAGAREAATMGALLDRVAFNVRSVLCGHSPEVVVEARSGPLHRPDRGHRVGAYKLFADGTFGGHTACLHEPFADREDARGLPTHPPERLAERIEHAHRLGVQVCTHAIGDAANAEVVAIYERLPAAARARHRIEHASLLDEATVRRLAAAGVVVCAQPSFITSEAAWLPSRLGRRRARRAYPLRDLLDAGVVVAASSDAPVETTSVLSGVEAAVARGGFVPEQAVTVDEALRMYTVDAAYAQHEEHEKGALEPGKRADLVVLDEHPAEVPSEQIHAVAVARTVVAGREVFAAPAGRT